MHPSHQNQVAGSQPVAQELQPSLQFYLPVIEIHLQTMGRLHRVWTIDSVTRNKCSEVNLGDADS